MRAVVAVALLAACAAKAKPRGTHPLVVHPSLPSAFSLDVVLHLPRDIKDTRLRLDGGGRPFLVTKDTFVPVQRLASGAPAKPFKIANADPIADVTWVDEGVVLLVAGSELGVLGEKGFTSILPLPAPDMRVVAASADQCWLFAPNAAEGRLYLYAKGGTVGEVLRVPTAIRAVSGTRDHAYVAFGGSLLRITKTQYDLVFDGPEDIVAVGATSTGAFFSTKSGTFFLSNGAEVSRISGDGALAIETHGDEVYFHLATQGIVRGAPTSAFSGTPAAAVAVTQPAPRDDSGMSGRRKLAIAAGLSGLALVGTGLWFGSAADDTYDAAFANGHCDANVVCDDIGFGQIEDAHGQARVATIATVAGAALVGTATYLWLTGRRVTATTTAITPVARDHVGFALWRRF